MDNSTECYHFVPVVIKYFGVIDAVVIKYFGVIVAILIKYFGEIVAVVIFLVQLLSRFCSFFVIVALSECSIRMW